MVAEGECARLAALACWPALQARPCPRRYALSIQSWCALARRKTGE
jgi:hypothetical protein